VPRPAVRDGIIYVTEDRKLEGFFETMSVAENIYLGAVAGGQSQSRIVRVAEMTALGVNQISGPCRHPGDDPGGNQRSGRAGPGPKPKLIIWKERGASMSSAIAGFTN
jgi:simple sugar transport system ATP-binding protein